jgi:hypothetical protein
MKFARLLFALLCVLCAAAYASDPEFGGQCAMAMSEGKKVSTDCSVLWVAPNDKVYCFHDDAAKRKFLSDPQENLKRAQANWQDPDNLRRLLRKE